MDGTMFDTESIYQKGWKMVKFKKRRTGMIKRLQKRCMAAMLALTMTIPMFGNMNVHAADKVVDTFYILDEEGNPVTIEITQSDLDSFTNEGMSYGLMPADETGEDAEEIVGIVRFNRDKTTFNYKNVKTGRTSYLSPLTTGEAAYLGTQEDGILCYVSGVEMLVDPADVAAIVPYKTIVDGEEKKELISTYYTADGYLLHNYTYFSDGDSAKPNTSTTRVGVAPSYLTERQDYFSYDGHYFYESFETMIEDYKNDTRVNSVNPDNPHYNYYQYLSFHTTAIYTADEYDAYIVDKKGEDSGSVMLNIGDEFVNTQNKYTINSLLMFGIAINESGWGLSPIAKDKNNLFGLKATDNNPHGNGTTYDSTLDCIEDFAYGWMHTGYLDGSDSRYRGPHLGDKSSGINVMYASDPYWGEKGASRPYYYDTTNADYGRFTLGIATASEINLYKEADTSSKVIYTSEAGPGGKLYHYPVIVLDTVTNDAGEVFYKIASDMALKDDRSARNVEDQYKPSRDYVYAKEKDIEIVLKGTGENTIIPDPEELSEHALKRHEYDTKFSWTDDYSKCSITFSCDECEINVVKDCKVTSKKSGDIVTYTATCEYEGKKYTNKKEVFVLPFTDVSENSWYADAVEYVYKNEIMKGSTATTFNPEGILTRAEYATILYRVHGEPDVTYTDVFQDVPDGTWYSDAVIWAYENEIIKGYGDGTFGTDDKITREQLAVMMHRYAEFMEYDTSETADIDDYPDADRTGDYAVDAMMWAVGSGMIKGTADNRLNPLGNASRAEAATIIMRFCEKYK